MEQPEKSYAEMVKSQLAHALVHHLETEERSLAEKLQRHH